MPYTPDTPETITSRLSAAYESAFSDVTPEGVDASSANAPFFTLAAVQALAVYGLHLHLGVAVADFFPDSCAESLVERHAARWGLARIAAEPAAGDVVLTGADGTVVPSGLEMTASDGRLYATTASVTLASGTATVAVEAAEAGAAGNLAADAVLTLTSPLAGLDEQIATVGDDGLSGGFDLETLETLRQRVIARIRLRPHGGGPGDYEAWVREIDPRVMRVRELPLWTGLGTVGVVIAMAGGRAPTSPELARFEAGLATRAPITVSALTVLPVVPTEIDLEITVTPDTTATRTAVEAAFALFLAAEPAIGGTLDRERLMAALSSAAGLYTHELTSPAADIVLADTELAVPGTITWGS